MAPQTSFYLCHCHPIRRLRDTGLGIIPRSGHGSTTAISQHIQWYVENGKNKPLKLETDTTLYSYGELSVNVLNEYTGNGAPLGEYYYAGQSIIGKKMFGNHGLDGRGPDLQTTGGLMYYQYDGLQNVSSLTNRLGEVIEDYRYDVFGNLYTGITAPYNTYGFTGMEYDPKAGLVNMHARWYAPGTGRFITPDSYSGDLMQPYTQNLYAYVGNNPVNRWDPLGYAESDMRSVWFENNSLSNGFETYAYEKVRYWTDSSNYSDTTKGSDGWYTSWMNSLYEYWLYNVYYSRAEYTGESTPDFGKSYDIVENRTYQTTFSQTSVSYGTNFTPFTSKEWYEEHKDDLISHGPLPPSTPSWLTKTISSNSFKYNSFNSSSGTDVLFSKSSTGTTNAQKPQVSIIQGLLNKALNNDTLKTDGLYGSQTQKAVTEFQKEYGLKVSGKVDEATMAKLLYIGTTQQSKVAQNLTAHKAEDDLSLQKFSAKYSTQGTRNSSTPQVIYDPAKDPRNSIPKTVSIIDPKTNNTTTITCSSNPITLPYTRPDLGTQLSDFADGIVKAAPWIAFDLAAGFTLGAGAAVLPAVAGGATFSEAIALVTGSAEVSSLQSEQEMIYFEQEALNFEETVNTIPAKTLNWLNKGEANNSVYYGIKDGEAVYTGITKQDLAERLYQHNYGPTGKGLDYLEEQASGLTRNQARAVEQFLIENGPANAMNKINSISPSSQYYNGAMQWANNFLNTK